MIRVHLCCNQVKGRWEVRDKAEDVLYHGTLDEVNGVIDTYGQLINEAQRKAINQDFRNKIKQV